MERQNIFHDRHARGRTRTGWLQSFHTFSFGSFQDPTRMGFSALRVINEDVVVAGSGFPEHAHDHFEILTFMLTGELEHRDSAGNVGRLGPGDVQLISSGTGIRHSERNPSGTASTHLFQIWLHGNADGEPPRYQHTSEALLTAPGAALRLVASATAEARENDAIECGGHGGKLLLAHPRGGDRKERQAEQQDQGPAHTSAPGYPAL